MQFQVAISQMRKPGLPNVANERAPCEVSISWKYGNSFNFIMKLIYMLFFQHDQSIADVLQQIKQQMAYQQQQIQQQQLRDQQQQQQQDQQQRSGEQLQFPVRQMEVYLFFASTCRESAAVTITGWYYYGFLAVITALDCIKNDDKSSLLGVKIAVYYRWTALFSRVIRTLSGFWEIIYKWGIFYEIGNFLKTTFFYNWLHLNTTQKSLISDDWVTSNCLSRTKKGF